MARKVMLLCLFILMLAPIWMMFTGSLQDISGVMKMPPKIWPSEPTVTNYVYVFTLPVFRWAMNTVILVSLTILLSVITHVTAGYVFAFYNFSLKSVIWSLLLLGIMVPRMSLLIPWYIIIKQLSISGTIIAVVLTSVYNPINLYLARNYFEGIPKSIMEAARIDGASDFKILTSIVMPISLPIIVAISLFASIAVLTEYVWPSLVLQAEASQTLMVGLIKAIMRRGTLLLSINPIGRQFTAGVVLTLPLLFIFTLANRYFITGITVGGIKE